METSNGLTNISFRTSHIFRAPLANILGLINIMRSSGFNDPCNEELLELISVSAKQLDRMINDVAADTANHA
jgi:signal transduction histidine kinase